MHNVSGAFVRFAWSKEGFFTRGKEGFFLELRGDFTWSKEE